MEWCLNFGYLDDKQGTTVVKEIASGLSPRSEDVLSWTAASISNVGAVTLPGTVYLSFLFGCARWCFSFVLVDGCLRVLVA